MPKFRGTCVWGTLVYMALCAGPLARRDLLEFVGPCYCERNLCRKSWRSGEVSWPGGGLGGGRVFGVGKDARKFHGTLHLLCDNLWWDPWGMKNKSFTGPLILAEVSWDPTSAVANLW